MDPSRRLVPRWLVAVLLAGCSHAPRAPARRLDPRIGGWDAATRARLDAMLAQYGSSSATYDPARRPVATLDWDNTMMRNDIGDATLAWMLAHDAVIQPPGRSWARTSPELSPAACAALASACDATGEPGQPMATHAATACAETLWSIYEAGATPAGATAWTVPVTLTLQAAYAWSARLLAGHTPAQIAAIARSAYAQNAAAPIGAVQTVGAHTDVAGYVRIYPAMRDLVGALGADGFDVWIVSASPQHVVEVVAREVGIAPDHVVGVRTVPNADGTAGYDLEPCGDAPANSVIPYNRGKRCFINRVVFHQPIARQLPRADAAHRQVFAAGDSDTDVAFVQDATALKLVIDRHRVELMCNAYTDVGARWLIEPMFIDPLPPRETPYPCASTRDAAGALIVDEEGHPMLDRAVRARPLGDGSSR